MDFFVEDLRIAPDNGLQKAVRRSQARMIKNSHQSKEN